MTTCCDKPLLTPFCPFCGKPNRDPLLEIATYLREQADKNIRQAEIWSENKSEHQQKRAATYALKGKRFASWAEQLIDIHKKSMA